MQVDKTTQLLEAVQTYLDMIHECDVDKLDQVFHEASSLFDADTGKIFVDPIAGFRADVASRPSPASRNQRRSDEIILVDWLSDISAMVKLRLQAHENVFVDHLCFVKGENGWEIVSKVWHLEGKAQVQALD